MAKTAKKQQEQQPLRILELRSENVKRLRAVRLELDGQSMVVVGGRNAQGKTSLLDSVEMLFRGAKAFPAEPVRRGAKKAKIVANLGRLKVERVIRPNRTHTLEIREDGGEPSKKPQEILDELCNRIAFDPLAFSTMEPEKQDATLRKLVGLDTSDLDQKEATSREARRLVNRDLKAAQAILEQSPERHGNVPDKEQTSAAILAELEEAEAERRDQQQARQALAEYDEETQRLEARLDSLNAEVERLRGELDRVESDAGAVNQQIANRDQERDDLAEAIDALVEPDTTAIRERLSTLEETNRKVRENAARKARQAEIDKLEQQVDDLSAEITQALEQRAERMGAAKYPVNGLSFAAGGGVLLNGLPLDQASQAERLRVSVAIGFALNPGIRVLLVRDGSLLDEEHLALLGKLAEEHDGQLLVERGGSKDPGAVVIEDGEILADD
jgi:energy-coupling factor transporter ATP-binding protein EcfA2